MNPNKLSFIIIFLLIVGCDCVTHKSGLVYDIKTNEPIQDAKVSLNSFTVSTDSMGRFAIMKISGFCPDWNIEVTKENYKTI